MQARIDRLRQEADPKIEALQEQAAETKADKEKIERRIAEIHADYERCSVELQQPREKTEEALAALIAVFGIALVDRGAGHAVEAGQIGHARGGARR